MLGEDLYFLNPHGNDSHLWRMPHLWRTNLEVGFGILNGMIPKRKFSLVEIGSLVG